MMYQGTKAVSNKISNLFKEVNSLDTETYKNLSPIMKEAVRDLFKLIEKSQENIVDKFENAINKVSDFHNINKKELYQYIENETNNQIGD
jgi:hypothetical protein